jgi:hypothetical protein
MKPFVALLFVMFVCGCSDGTNKKKDNDDDQKITIRIWRIGWRIDTHTERKVVPFGSFITWGIVGYGILMSIIMKKFQKVQRAFRLLRISELSKGVKQLGGGKTHLTKKMGLLYFS